MNTSTLHVNAPLSEPFRLDNWTVKPELNCIQQTVPTLTEVSLEPRLMHLLCYLAANRGKLLTRDQIIDELWPRVVVNENSLTRAVSELRKQLSRLDSPRQKFLETIPKKGYRLVPGVGVQKLTQADTQTERSGERDVRQVTNSADSGWLEILGRIWQPAITMASVSLLLATTVTQPNLIVSAPEQPQEDILIADQVIDSDYDLLAGRLSLSAADLTHESSPGIGGKIAKSAGIVSPVISDDGQTLAFIRQEQNQWTIYLSPVESVDKPLAVFQSDDRLFNLSWSPLGDALLFASAPIVMTSNLMSNPQHSADLVMLDLESLETRILLDNGPRQSQKAPTEVNLT